MNRLNETVKTDGQENIDNFVAQSFWLTKPVTFLGACTCISETIYFTLLQWKISYKFFPQFGQKNPNQITFF